MRLIICYGFLVILALFSLNKKISNLKMNCDDILLLIGLSKKKTLINLNLNFFQERKKEKYL